MGIRWKFLLGKKREGESGGNSCGFRMDVKSREAFKELCRYLLFSWMEFSCLPLSIPQSVSSSSPLMFFNFKNWFLIEDEFELVEGLSLLVFLMF